jgi:hypothetical protein
MGSKHDKVSNLRHPERYLAEGCPEAVSDAAQCVIAARTALRLGQKEIALHLYVRATRLWHELDGAQPGRWSAELRGTRKELVRLLERH